MEKISQSVVDGLVTTTMLDDDGKMHVNYAQDSAPAFEVVQSTRNDGHAWRVGVKKDMVHAMHITNGVVHELMAFGINPYTATMKELVLGLKRINRYEACDMTGKRLA